jgi:hypothetical protein
MGDIIMDIIQIVSELVTKVGFPIACCIVLFNQNSNLQKVLGEIQVTMQKMVDELEDLGDKRNDKGD